MTDSQVSLSPINQTQESSSSKQFQWPLILASGLLIVFSGITGFYFGTLQVSLKKDTQLVTATPIPSINTFSNNSPTEAAGENFPIQENSEKIIWKSTDSLGVMRFEYPYGWHVAQLWPENQGDGIQVVVDRNPISTAPRGGSLDNLFFVKFNDANPEAKLQEKITTFKNNLENMKETQIQGANGEIAYITGMMDIYGKLEPVEGYFLLIPAQNPEDKMNYQVISAIIGKDSQNAPILKHIIESMERND